MKMLRVQFKVGQLLFQISIGISKWKFKSIKGHLDRLEESYC